VTPKLPRFFEGDDITGVSDNAKGAGIPVEGAADFTDGIGGQVKTDGAVAHLFLGLNQGIGKGLNLVLGTFENVQGKALGCFGANTGEPLQFLIRRARGRV